MQRIHHADHSLRRVLGTKQLLLRNPLPKLPAQPGPHRSRMIRHGHGLVATPRPEHHIQALGDAIHRSLAGAVREPAPRPVVRDGPDPRRHEHPRSVRGQPARLPAAHVRPAPRQKLRKVLHEQQRPQRVHPEHGQARVGVYLRGALLGRQDPRHRKRQVQVVAVRGEQPPRRVRGRFHRRRVRHVHGHEVQARRGRVAVLSAVHAL